TVHHTRAHDAFGIPILPGAAAMRRQTRRRGMTRKARRKRLREQQRSMVSGTRQARAWHSAAVAPRVAAPWALVGTLVATTAFPRAARAHELSGRHGRDERRAVVSRSPALADGRVASADQSGDVGAGVQQFDIAAGPLKTVLAALRHATGLTILLPDAVVG